MGCPHVPGTPGGDVPASTALMRCWCPGQESVGPQQQGYYGIENIYECGGKLLGLSSRVNVSVGGAGSGIE